LEPNQTTLVKKHNSWPNVDGLGVITGCGMARFSNKTGQCKPGAERLYRILMSESAHLIWKIQYERIIQRNEKDQWHTIKENRNRWLDLDALNKRLVLDKATTSKRYEKRALTTKIVLATWSGTPQDELSLPDNWIEYPGVLMGSGPLEQTWWQRAALEPP
jgi:ribonuclease HI